MAANSGLPGVDPEALSDLAKQFSGAGAAPTPNPTEAIIEPAPSVVRTQPRPRGAGFAVFLAFLALLVAAYPVVLPHVRPWLLAEYGYYPEVQLLLRRTPDAALAPEALDAVSARLRAVEAKQEVDKGGVNDMAGRIATVESRLSALDSKLGRVMPEAPADGTAATRPESIEAWAVSASARVESLEKNFDGAVGRISRLESAFDSTQKRLEAVPPASGVPSARVEKLEASIVSAMERLAKVEGELGGAQAASARINELAPLITAATERLGAVEGKGGALESRFPPIESKLTAVEERLTQAADGRTSVRNTLRDVQLLLALLQLNAVSQTHKPFAKEVEVVRGLANGDGSILAQINVIADVAQTGVATAVELRDSFAMIVVPKIQSVSGSDWALTDRVRVWLSNAIAPAGTGTTAPDKDPTAEIIVAATDKLTEDDVAGAIQQLGQLAGPAATLASRWVTEARARLMINTVSDALGGLMLERLGAAAAQPQPQP